MRAVVDVHIFCARSVFLFSRILRRKQFSIQISLYVYLMPSFFIILLMYFSYFFRLIHFPFVYGFFYHAKDSGGKGKNKMPNDVSKTVVNIDCF